MASTRTRVFVAGWLGAVTCALPAASALSAEAFSLSGFVQSHAAARAAGVDCAPATKCDFPAAELRAQVKAEGANAAGSAAFMGRLDFVRDAALGDSRTEVRELYGDAISDKAAVRIGRQVITWGVGDLLFVNDTFPKDWSAFYTGQPMQYLKLGSDAVKLNLYPGAVAVELVAADFRADNLPDGRRFVLADPLPSGLPRRIGEPRDGTDSLEWAAKFSGYLESWEWAAYLSRTHYRSPAMRVAATEIAGFYPRLNTYGASLAGSAAGGVLSFEGAYYDSRDDRDGRDASIENSQWRGLAGYTRQLWEDATLGVQAYVERMSDYDSYRATLPAGFPLRDETRSVATLRFTQLFSHQTVTFNLFAFWGVSDRDRYVIPSLRYAFNDNLWVEGGANLFCGSRTGMFGAMRDNNNVYLTLRYAF